MSFRVYNIADEFKRLMDAKQPVPWHFVQDVGNLYPELVMEAGEILVDYADELINVDGEEFISEDEVPLVN